MWVKLGKTRRAMLKAKATKALSELSLVPMNLLKVYFALFEFIQVGKYAVGTDK